ncbi:formamidopyrimidine-DNA glycosylase [Rhodococcoides trifolii]|uniref:Formamidopyrimidine-DNA glycosylase n=1 Tax=Rhodococcoides trifolii TaxID=908250 RepID=A0A917LEJ8_9NOCA|nr:DNA-formamidopyrimidine glycosylase family protein [Rhodococcus trifolii]GGG15572.1 formamidopyrimidine-DNA glycosylase [Rhodococcus trifolii]
MPELPEVENARQVVEKGLHRVITDIDDRDTYECRPHRPGEIADALVGGQLVQANRRGKAMWCDTVTADGSAGPTLGMHLGMGGRIIVTAPEGDQQSSYGGGDPHVGVRDTDKPEWTRFTMTFDDGGQLRLFDKRRLGRVRLEPDIDALGPDAAEIDRDQFRERIGKSTTALKARLLDQAVLSGVGNLLADEVLWQSAQSPSRRANTLTTEELDDLRKQLRKSIRAAIKHGGVHTGEIIPSRKADATCPRCGAPMVRGTVGGRTTWWCSREQA